jgi:hypothetical protein
MTPAAIVLGQAGADFDRHGVIPVHFAALLQKFQGAETAFAANDPVMQLSERRPRGKLLCRSLVELLRVQ